MEGDLFDSAGNCLANSQKSDPTLLRLKFPLNPSVAILFSLGNR